MNIEFKSVVLGNMEEERWLRWLDAEIFPNDIPFFIKFANWFIGWDSDKNAVAYCGWKPVIVGPKYDLTTMGFHYRSGVMPVARGQGLQQRMIDLREQNMKKHNIFVACTYTEVYSAASMRSLINAGYRPYEATDDTALTGLDRYKRFVHWKKNLV